MARYVIGNALQASFGVQPLLSYQLAAADSTTEISESAHDVLDEAGREASAMGCRYCGTEHLLLALIHSADDAVVRLVRSLGLDYDCVFSNVTREMRTEADDEGKASANGKAAEILSSAVKGEGQNLISGKHCCYCGGVAEGRSDSTQPPIAQSFYDYFGVAEQDGVCYFCNRCLELELEAAAGLAKELRDERERLQGASSVERRLAAEEFIWQVKRQVLKIAGTCGKSKS